MPNHQRVQQVGYKRVSTAAQNDARQLDGVTLDKTFEEAVSAKTAHLRPKLRECMDYCRAGDTLHVHSIDRLARNMRDLLDIVSELRDKGVTIQFHSESLTFKAGSEDAMAELMLQMLGAFAQFERTLINSRRKEGLAAAAKRGRLPGRKSRFTSAQIKEIQARYAAGISVIDLAEEHGVSRQSIYAVLKKVV